jgi:hypothetical protein
VSDGIAGGQVVGIRLHLHRSVIGRIDIVLAGSDTSLTLPDWHRSARDGHRHHNRTMGKIVACHQRPSVNGA